MNKGINHFEYTRGLITASIIWLGFVIFLAITTIISDLTEWAFGDGWLQSLVFISFVVISVIYLMNIGNLAFNKLTRNRFKYFSTEKIKEVLSGMNEND